MICKKSLAVVTLIFLLLPFSSFYGYGKPPPTRPDLMVESIELTPSHPLIFEAVTVKIVVKNIGTDMSCSVNGSLRIDYDEIGVVVIPQLDHNENVTLTLYWTPDALGTHVVSFIADCYQEINEDDEGNNEMEVNVTVGGGDVDLEVYDIVIFPEIPSVGHNISFKPCIRNIGTDDSPSCEGVFYVDGEVLATVDIPPIVAGGSHTGESEEWMPGELGSYNITFWADSSEIIDEDDEDNNYYSVSLDVTGEDSTPPVVAITYSPDSVTEMDSVTFYATATDDSGISYIEIVVHSEPSYIYNSSIFYNTTSCSFTYGPFPRKDMVFYYAQARDKTGITYRTPTYNFTVESFYTGNLTVNISISPAHPTEVDTINITAEAWHPYGVKMLKILNYKTHNYTMIQEENVTTLTRGPLGPFMAGTRLAYWAMAEDIDGHIAYSPVIDITVEALPEAVNVKDMSSYRTKEVFLISDLDWRAVLSLVPITIWKNQNGSITKYPVLIYHKENETAFDADAIIRFLQQYAGSGIERHRMRVTILGDPPDELLRLLVAPPPVGPHLSESRIRIWESPSEGESPTIIGLDLSPLEVDDFRMAMDVKWGVSVSLLGDGGSGVVPMKDIFTIDEERQLREEYWSDLNLYVVCEDEYATGLMASVFASYFNAPIVFQGHYDLEELYHKNVYLVGDFTEGEVNTIREGNVNILYRFWIDDMLHPQDLRRHYALATGTDKVILVNPLDLWTNYRLAYQTDKASNVSYLYGKHSLAAPFLAAAKEEVILCKASHSYPEIDSFVKESMETLPLRGSLQYLTIVASPEAIPIARPNAGYPVGLCGDRIYYEGFRYSDVDIVSNNLLGDDEEYVTFDRSFQFNPVCSEDVIAWVDEITWGDIWYRDLDTGRDYRLTGASGSRAEQMNPVVYDRIIVWQDSKHLHTTDRGTDIPGTNHQSEIYMYDTATRSRTRVTISNASQVRPAIWGKAIVWQDNRNGRWDIYKYNIDSGMEERITSDPGNQEKPSISFNKIVYVDDRNGNWEIYMSWLGVGGQGVAGERRITNDPGMQWRPCIYGDKIVWQDNRHGNWDVYLYDLSTDSERRITTESIDQVLPVIWEDIIVWKERSDDGWWHVCLYDISTGYRSRIARTGVSSDDGPRWLEVDGRYYGSTQNLAHQDVATGRIYGVTVSDASAYIARDIFFDKIPRNRDALVVVGEDWQAGIIDGTDEVELENYARGKYWTVDVESQFSYTEFYSGHREVFSQRNRIYSRYDDCGLLIFVDHGYTGGFTGMMDSWYLRDNKIYLEPATILDLACLTGAYYAEVTTNGYSPLLFAAQNMRRGAMVYMGATDVSYWHTMFDNILEGVYLDGKTIGQAYLEARNEDYDDDPWNFSLTLKGDIFYTLYGDPTFTPRWW